MYVARWPFSCKANGKGNFGCKGNFDPFCTSRMKIFIKKIPPCLTVKFEIFKSNLIVLLLSDIYEKSIPNVLVNLKFSVETDFLMLYS